MKIITALLIALAVMLGAAPSASARTGHAAPPPSPPAVSSGFHWPGPPIPTGVRVGPSTGHFGPS
jgi:hypothetical protein